MADIAMDIIYFIASIAILVYIGLTFYNLFKNKLKFLKKKKKEEPKDEIGKSTAA